MRKILIATAILATATTSMIAPSSAANMRMVTPITSTLEPILIHHTKSNKVRKGQKYRSEILSPRRIARKLNRQGYGNIERIRFRDGRYRVRAWGHRGPVRLIVNARSGKVMYRERIRRGHQNNHRRNYSGKNGGFSWSFTIR